MSTSIARSIALALSALLSANVLPATATSSGERGLRFDSPGVLDLAERTQTIVDAAPVGMAELAAADAEAVFAATASGEDPPPLRFSEDQYGCKPAAKRCQLQHESALLHADAAVVKRTGRRLSVQPATGDPLAFIDWKQAATRSADGDEESHWYLGRIPGSGYLRVEVQFGHDAPGSFMVNPQSGKVAFVHNGADLAVPSPDGALLLTWNALNPPFSLRVAALDAAGPRLVLQCSVPDGGTRITPLFKGWHGAAAFDIVLEIGEPGKAQPRVALRATATDGRWRVGASDVARIEALHLSCGERAGTL